MIAFIVIIAPSMLLGGWMDLCAEFVHHDGTNYVTYREWKEGVSETQKENLKVKLMRDEATRKDITRLTRKLGDRIAAVYT